MEAQLAYVSTPGSPGYGKYIDLNEQVSSYAPSAEAQGNVTSWLKGAGISSIKTDGSVVSFTTSVGQANKLLDTSFGLYTDGKTTKLRTTQYSIPDHLTNVIDLVSPTTYFGDTRAQLAIPLLLVVSIHCICNMEITKAQ